jgi:hypothetical protein
MHAKPKEDLGQNGAENFKRDFEAQSYNPSIVGFLGFRMQDESGHLLKK